MLCFVQPLPAFLVARTVFDGGLVDLTMLAASGIIGWAGWVVTLWDLGKPEP